MTAARPSGERPDDEIDEVFAQIVAGWDDPAVVPDEHVAGPPQAPATRPDRPPAEPTGSARPFQVAPPGWRVHITPTEEELDEVDGFVPPDPPLPKGDPVFWGAVLGLVLGPILLILLVVTNPYGDKLPMWGAGLLTVTGFALLVSRLPTRHDDDDDGARV